MGSGLGIILGVLSGIVMMGLLSTMRLINHAARVRKELHYSGKDVFEVHHEREIELPLSFIDSYKLCVESVRQIYNCQITISDKPKGLIIAKDHYEPHGPMSRIEWRLTKSTDDSATHIHVSSTPELTKVYLDNGFNLENVITIKGFLNAKTENEIFYNQLITRRLAMEKERSKVGTFAIYFRIAIILFFIYLVYRIVQNYYFNKSLLEEFQKTQGI